MRSFSPFFLRLLVLFCCALAVAALAINNGSLWDDEGYRSFFALNGELANMLAYSGRDKQFAFVFYEYVWLALFPHSEAGMRAMNIPFLLLGVGYLARMLHNRGMSPLWAAVMLLHPMVWYYVNDVSPYIIMLAASLGLCFHTFFAEKPSSWGNIAGLNIWFLVGYACHFIFGFAYFAVAAGLLLQWRRERPVWGRYAAVFAVFCLAYVPLTWWYWVHMEDGAVNYGWGRPGVANIAYVVYSFLGMQGMGLSRLDIRAGEWSHLTPEMVALLATFAVGSAALVLLNARTAVRVLRQRWVAGYAACALVFYAGAFMQHFQFWERHVMMLAVLPLILIPQFGHALAESKPSLRRRLSLGLLAVLGLCWGISAMNLSFQHYYAKDDFKGAAQLLSRCDEHIPMLAQGNRFVFFYYDHIIPYQMPNERMLRGFGNERGKVILLNQLPAETQVALVRAMVRSHGKAYFLLCRRDTSLAGGNPTAVRKLFTDMGYIVQVEQELNMFTLFRLESAPNGGCFF